MFASGFCQPLEVPIEELPEVPHHLGHVIVVFIVRDRGEQMRSRHRELDWASGKGRHGPKFVDQPEIYVVDYGPTANRSRVENVRIVPGDGLRLGLTLEGRYFLPEMVQHRVGRRMP